MRQLRHQRRRAGQDITLAKTPRRVTGPQAQLRHQRRRAGKDIILGKSFPKNRRLLRIKKSGGEQTTLARVPLNRRLLRIKKSGGENTTLAYQDLRMLRIRKSGGETTVLNRAPPRGSLLKAGLFPRSHVLTKDVGQTVVARWSVSNLGTATGRVRLKILEGSVIRATGITVNIAAGLPEIGLIMTYTLEFVLAPGSHSMTLLMEDLTSSPIRIIGTHRWTMNIPTLSAGLVASTSPGQPTIN